MRSHGFYIKLKTVHTKYINHIEEFSIICKQTIFSLNSDMNHVRNNLTHIFIRITLRHSICILDVQIRYNEIQFLVEWTMYSVIHLSTHVRM